MSDEINYPAVVSKYQQMLADALLQKTVAEVQRDEFQGAIGQLAARNDALQQEVGQLSEKHNALQEEVAVLREADQGIIDVEEAAPDSE
jgi:FtsZ-binding cell division protein ZapB